jgi:hypothetical protein
LTSLLPGETVLDLGSGGAMKRADNPEEAKSLSREEVLTALNAIASIKVAAKK